MPSVRSILTFNLRVRTMRDPSQLYDNMTFRFICGYMKFYHSFNHYTDTTINTPLALYPTHLTHRTTSVQYMPFHSSATDE